MLCFGHRNAATTIGIRHTIDRAMRDDRSEVRIYASKYALRFAKWICEDHTRPASLDILKPPFVYLLEDLSLRLPVIDRKSESRFGDERVALDKFKWLARHIRLDLVIARHDP